MEGPRNIDPGESPPPSTHRLSGREALKLHATLLGGLALCALAFWFELGRALGGNNLSWAYVFEWPLLGGFAIYMWWKFLHPNAPPRPSRHPERPAIAPEYEGMLAAWTEHQRELATRQGTPTPDVRDAKDA